MEKCPKDREDWSRFVDKWKPLKLKTSKPKEFWNEKMWSELEKRFDTERFHKKNFHNQLSQLYSIQQVSELVEDYSQYDFIITIRSDINIWDYPDLNSIPKNKFYLSSHAMPFPDLDLFLHHGSKKFYGLMNTVRKIW